MMHKNSDRVRRLGTWLAVLLSSAAGLAVLPPTNSTLANLDRRTDGHTNQMPPTALVAQLQLQLPGIQVAFDPVSGAPKSIAADGSFLTGAGGRGKTVNATTAARFAASDPYGPTKAFVQEHRGLFGHGPEALNPNQIKREFVTEHNGLRTVVWEQQVDGIPLFEATFISHTTRNGELVNVSSHFVPDPAAAADLGVASRRAVQTLPNLSAGQAVVLAAKNIEIELDEQALTLGAGLNKADPEKRQSFQAMQLKGLAETKLIWLPMDSSRLRLCWDVILSSASRGEMYRVLVDAQTGEVQLRHCLTDYLSNASYRVYTSDSPSPLSPTFSMPTNAQPPLTSRSLTTLSALDTNASPNGWINDGGNETWGNNVDAHTDTNANNVADLPRPQGSPARVFDFSMDLSQAPNTYSSAAVVQLFYWNNFMHDKLYQLGFTEAAGNFQSNNFARGGLGGDAVQADAQDGSGVNNANFSTPPDGSAGRMQMYLFSGPAPDRDGDFDADVVLHEYTHGLSNRRVGGGVGLSALQSRGMGEGWSDFYALCLLSEAGDDVNGAYAAGAYATYQLNGLTQNYYYGIRRYPYCTDTNKNPLTFKDIDPSQASAHSGVPRSPIINPTANEVHNMGEVWCMALREVWAKLVTKYGSATGNQLTLQLVTDGMNLSPANPNFLQARNAILQADQVNTGGANQIELWAAFAKRGMGYTATSPSSSSTSGLHEAYDVPIVQLRLVMLSGTNEGAGMLFGAGQVGLPAAAVSNVVVQLSSSDTSEVTVPTSVTILAGQTNASFNLAILDDLILDGTQTATITASATGYSSAGGTVAVFDNETATLTLTNLPTTVTEGDGLYSGRVNVNATPADNITVTLGSSDPMEIQVPATVVILAGQTSAVFAVNVVDDNQLDGPQAAIVTAHVQNWTDDSKLINVLDNETTNLTVTLPTTVNENAGVLTGAGSVKLSGTLTSNLLVSLVSGAAARLTVASTVTIPAGQLSNTFNLTAVDNNLQDGNQIASVIASAPGFLNGTNLVLVVDDDIPPIILAQPMNLSVIVGQTAYFSVVVGGKTPLSYQWKFNGFDIADATNATFTFPNAQFSDAGNYAVSVTNIYGRVDSSNAILTVTPPVCAPPASGILAWWRGDGDASDNLGNSPGTVVGSVAYDAGEVGQSFSFNGSSGYVSIPDSAMLDSISNRFTVEVWFRNNVIGNNGDWAGIVCKGNTAWRLQATAFADTVTFSATGATSDLVGTRSVNDGQWHHAAGVYDGTNIFLYIDGTLDGFHVSSGSIAQNDYPVAIGANANPPGVTYYFNGSVDEVAIYNRALSASEIESIYFAGGLGKCFTPTPPTITTQPASRTNIAGTVATFSVAAGGTSPLSYQWAFNGTSIIDETNTTLTLPNVQPGEAGTYAVTVSNPGGVTNSVDAILTVVVPPPATITTQPASRTNIAGSLASFTVSATGAAPLTYQWTFNGTSITDETNTTLTISNVQPVHAGAYAVVVNNPGGATNSADAILTVVLPPPPAITTQPVSRTNFVGSTASFSVTATGTPPLSYQWTFSGAPITDATNATLTLPNVDLFQAGNYAVTVTNYGGAANSVDAILTVIPPACVPPSSGMIASWPGEGDFSDVLGASTGTPVGSVAFSTGKVGQGFALDGSSSYVSIPDSPLFKSLTNRLTVEFWFQNNAIGNNGDWAGIVCKGNTSWRMQATAFANTITFSATGTSSDVIGTRNVNDGQWHHAAGVYDGTNIFLYIDGTLDVSHPSTGRIATNNYPIAIGANANPPGVVYYFNGSVDEVAIYDRALSASHIEAIYLAGSYGKCLVPIPPTITTHPVSRTNIAGTQAAFTVAANGTLPLNCQWTFNGTNINNATNATLVLNNVQVSQAGSYAVTVSNLGGSTNSVVAILTVFAFPPPTITAQPASRTNVVGTLATFGVTANSGGPLSYQWTFNGTNIANATNATLSLTNVQFSQGGSYAVSVANAAGSTNSAPGLLVVTVADCLPPVSGIVAWWRAEGNANDAMGGNPGTLVGGAGFTTGEVGQGFSFNGSASYVSITNSALLNSLTNRLTVELWLRANSTNNNPNWAGLIAKGDAAWRLQAVPSAKTLAFSANGTTGGDVFGSRNVNDGQWHHAAGVYDGTNMLLYVDGTLDASKPSTGKIATNALPLLIGANAIYYYNGLVDEVALYNRALSSNEIAAIYIAGTIGKCLPTAPAITTQPAGRTNVNGMQATFDVVATGTPPLSYIWQKNGTPIGGSSTASLTLTNVTRTNSGNYRVVVTNALGSATSSNAVLLVRVPQRLGTPIRLADGTFTFLSSDADGGIISAGDLSRFEAQASTNLVSWTTLPGALTFTNGSLWFNNASTNAPMRFYRIIEN